MIQGTTPVLRFVLPFSVDTLTAVDIVFVQESTVVLQKDLDDCTAQDNVLELTLTSGETSAFSEGLLHIQLRVTRTDSAVMVSRQITDKVIGSLFSTPEVI